MPCVCTGGARKTKAGKGQWEHIAVVSGFPNKISSLQFEWAVQHGAKSSFLSQYRTVSTKSTKNYLRNTFLLLASVPFSNFGLTVQVVGSAATSLWREILGQEALPAPSWRSIQSVSDNVCVLLCDNQHVCGANHGAVPASDRACGICGLRHSGADIMTCQTPRMACGAYTIDGCSAIFHPRCLAAQQLSGTANVIPSACSCPRCGKAVSWAHLVRNVRGGAGVKQDQVQQRAVAESEEERRTRRKLDCGTDTVSDVGIIGTTGAAAAAAAAGDSSDDSDDSDVFIIEPGINGINGTGETAEPPPPPPPQPRTRLRDLLVVGLDDDDTTKDDDDTTEDDDDHASAVDSSLCAAAPPQAPAAQSVETVDIVDEEILKWRGVFHGDVCAAQTVAAEDELKAIVEGRRPSERMAMFSRSRSQFRFRPVATGPFNDEEEQIDPVLEVLRGWYPGRKHFVLVDEVLLQEALVLIVMRQTGMDAEGAWSFLLDRRWITTSEIETAKRTALARVSAKLAKAARHTQRREEQIAAGAYDTNEGVTDSSDER